jgi:hypothetical protein
MNQKPLVLEMDEAKQELVQCVNDILSRHGLNCYLIEPMFAELYREIKASAQNELARARAEMAETQRAELNATQRAKDGAE